MKDVTIQVVKSEKDYRLIINEDDVTEYNIDGWKSNDSEVSLSGKEQVLERVQKIINDLE